MLFLKLFFLFLIFKYILLIILLQFSHFSPFIPLCPAHPLLPALPPLSSCPWVIYISSLASTFPILFLSSPCLFSTYHLFYLFSVPFPHSPSSPCPLVTLHVISISVILFLFQVLAQFVFSFGFVLGSVVDSCEFVVILLFIVLIFFFLGKSL